MLTRYALFDPAAFILVELGPRGTEGTGLDQPCLTDHHGIVTHGTFRVHQVDGSVTAFDAGDAFYVPAGPPAHSFSASPGCVVGGFAPLVTEPDTTPAALAAQGFSVVADPDAAPLPPTTIRLAGAVAPFSRTGAISVDGSVMGKWLFMRSQFGPRSGYTSGRCDLAHWGLVLDGEIAISYPDRTELAARGDIYVAEPNHKITSPDGATIADYTPLDGIDVDRIATWRRAVIRDVAPDALGGARSASAAHARSTVPASWRGASIPRTLRLAPG